MAIEHIATNLCDYLIRSQDDRVSLIGTFQNIAARTLPAVKDPFGVVVQFRGENGDTYRLTLDGPNLHRELGEGTVETPTDLHEFQQWSVTAIMEARPAVFAQEGVYEVTLWSGDTPIHRHPFGVFRSRSDEEREDA